MIRSLEDLEELKVDIIDVNLSSDWNDLDFSKDMVVGFAVDTPVGIKYRISRIYEENNQIHVERQEYEGVKTTMNSVYIYFIVIEKSNMVVNWSPIKEVDEDQDGMISFREVFHW